MAVTIPDVILSGDTYYNINSSAGIASGSSLLILNKSSKFILVQVQLSQPPASSTNGWIVLPHDNVVITTAAGESCWIKGNGPVYVQEYIAN